MAEQRNIMLTLEYDGTDWHGWQVQQNARTIQGELEQALAKITGEAIRLTGSSRTDAGVHALGQVCNFRTTSRIPLERIPFALNANLPASIVVRAAKAVPAEFHARFQASGKRYKYKIRNSHIPSALQRNFCWRVPGQLDLTAMQQAASFLQGRHDFKAFQAAGSPVTNTVRNLICLRVTRTSCTDLAICAIGDGFLYNMVRILVGTLVQVGLGKRLASDMPLILSQRDRLLAGPTAPPHGLYLEKVYYEEDPALTLEMC